MKQIALYKQHRFIHERRPNETFLCKNEQAILSTARVLGKLLIQTPQFERDARCAPVVF